MYLYVYPELLGSWYTHNDMSAIKCDIHIFFPSNAVALSTEFVTRDAIRQLFSLLTSFVKIIAKSSHSWQKSIFTITHTLLHISYFSDAYY